MVEALGYAHHRSEEQLTSDLAHEPPQLLGFTVFQFTTRQIVSTPSLLVATISEALESSPKRSVA